MIVLFYGHCLCFYPYKGRFDCFCFGLTWAILYDFVQCNRSRYGRSSFCICNET